MYILEVVTAALSFNVILTTLTLTTASPLFSPLSLLSLHYHNILIADSTGLDYFSCTTAPLVYAYVYLSVHLRIHLSRVKFLRSGLEEYDWSGIEMLYSVFG